MGKSGAERQAAYRERQLKSEEGTGARLDMVIEVSGKYALERLAVRYRVTQREMLERLIKTAEGNAVRKLSAQEERDYYDKIPPGGRDMAED